MFLCKVPLEGFNACLFQLPDGTFHGTIRRKHIISHKQYPEVFNELILFTLNKDFQLIDAPKIVKDIPGRIKHRSWTEGLEDARIIEPGLLLAVACDTNPHWKPEMVAVKYDQIAANLLSLKSLTIQGQPRKIEKNWLPLRRWGNELHLLHWLHPLRILRLNLDTGLAEVLIEYPIIANLQGQEIHCGACLHIDQGFLVAVRVKSVHDYSHSLWLLLDSDSYEVKGVSEPFRFESDKTGKYEMCMSLCLQNTNLLACVSINDEWSGIWKFSLEDILKGLREVAQ